MKHALALFAPLLLLASAHAGTGQIQFSLSQTLPISSTAVWSPSADGNYIVMDAGNCPTLNAGLSYTNDQGNPASVTLSWNPVAIRVKGGTTAYAAAFANAACTGTVDFYFEAIAVNTSSDEQAGITEPYSHSWFSQTSAVFPTKTSILTVPATSADYLFTLDVDGNCGTNCLATLYWTDEQGNNWSDPIYSVNYTEPSNPWLIHPQAGSKVYLSQQNVGTTSYDMFVKGIRFDAPSSGSGPLTSTEYDLLNTSTITYPNTDTVLTVPSSAEYFVLGIFESDETVCTSPAGIATFSARYYANGSQVDMDLGSARYLQNMHLLGSTGYRFLTNTYSTGGCSPAPGAIYSEAAAAVSF